MKTAFIPLVVALGIVLLLYAFAFSAQPTAQPYHAQAAACAAGQCTPTLAEATNPTNTACAAGQCRAAAYQRTSTLAEPATNGQFVRTRKPILTRRPIARFFRRIFRRRRCR